MATALVYKSILQALCNNKGSLDFGSLKKQISQHFTVAEELLRTVLYDDGKIAIKEGKEQARTGEVINPDSLVVAKTSLRLCQDKICQEECDNLHLCRYYVCGDCSFKDRCKNSHSLMSPHNATVLKRFGLHDLTEKQLFQLLLQNDPYLLPEICPHYNKGAGEHGSCRFPTSCTKLHMCQHYLQGDCNFGPKCKRAHSIDAQQMKMFKQYSEENITGLFKIYRNKLIIMDWKARPVPVLPEASPTLKSPSKALPSKPPTAAALTHATAAPAAKSVKTEKLSDADRNEICLYFILRHCSFNEKCVRVHWHLPYKWEIWDGSNMTWKNTDNMEEIEKAYSNPANNTSCTDAPTTPSGILRPLTFPSSAALDVQSVDFIKMVYGTSPVRRLSTASSVSTPPHYILTTEWKWYWKDDKEWVEYGQNGTGDTTASLTSQTLENVYLSNRDEEIEFNAGKHKYKLYFKGSKGLQMYQQNLQFNTIREVRRRPRFVSAHEVEVKLKSAPSSSSSSSVVETLPSHWDRKALPEIGYKLVPISNSAKEYNMVEMLFKQTMHRRKLISIKRIQNPSLWKVFQWQKDQMKKRNNGKPVDEKHLFHGTDKSLIEAICDQNFDWRVCGIHGTAYGKGSYFARDASYTVRFCTDSRTKIVFVALVLVGDYTKGHSHYVRPPSKGNSSTLYDSCVNCERDPNIFVIFEKQQIYPEYLIEYS